MKAFIKCLSLLAFLLILSCSKEKLESIDPLNEQSILSRALLIEGKNLDGEPNLADISPGNNILSYSRTALVTGDNYLFVPFVYENASEVSKIFFFVEGADNYWTIPFEPNDDKTQVLRVGIPKNVEEGQVNIIFGLVDNQGKSGRPVNMGVNIESASSPCADGGNFPQVSGNDGLTVKSYDLGNSKGMVSVFFDTYTVPDRVDIRYNNQWVFSTGSILSNSGNPPIKLCNAVVPGDGFIGTGGYQSFSFFYDPDIGRKVDVYVSGCLNDGTAWNFYVSGCPGEGEVLGVHSNAAPGGPIDEGHSWLTISDSVQVTSYALWPDDNPLIQSYGLSNGNGSDVRKNFTPDLAGGTYNRYYQLNASQKSNLEALVSNGYNWMDDDFNCASFVEKVVFEVLGEKISSSEVFLNASPKDTPRKLSESINELEASNPTDFLAPSQLTGNNTECSVCK